jgi:hypothetical protein
MFGSKIQCPKTAGRWQKITANNYVCHKLKQHKKCWLGGEKTAAKGRKILSICDISKHGSSHIQRMIAKYRNKFVVTKLLL